MTQGRPTTTVGLPLFCPTILLPIVGVLSPTPNSSDNISIVGQNRDT